MSIIPHEGEFKRRFSNGTLLLIECRKDWKFEGKRKIWYKNGCVKMQAWYKNGNAEGEYKFWYASGNLAHHLYIKNDECIDHDFSWKKKKIFIKLKNLFTSNFSCLNTLLISDLKKTLQFR